MRLYPGLILGRKWGRLLLLSQPGSVHLQRPEQRRERARRAVLLGLVTYLGLHVALALAAVWSRWLRDPVYADKERKWRQLTAGQSVATQRLIFLGTSRVANGFAAGEAQRRLQQLTGRPYVVFNWGVPASGPVTQSLHLRRLLATGQRVDVLLWEIFPPLLAEVPGGPVEARFSEPWPWDQSELVLLEHYDFPVAAWQRQRRQAWLAPWWTWRFRLLGRLAPSWLPHQLRYDWSRGPDPWGWSPIVDTTQVAQRRPARIERARQEYASVLQQWRPAAPAESCLRELLAWLRPYQTTVILVWMPEGPSFQTLYPPAARQRIEQWLQQLCEREKVQLIDCRYWMTEDDFVDGHHLLPEGAIRWTRRLTDTVLHPLLVQDN